VFDQPFKESCQSTGHTSIMNRFLIAILFLLSSCSKTDPGSTQSPPTIPIDPNNRVLDIKGADMSFLPEIRQSGIVFKNAANQPEDMLATIKASGVNVVRLRLWKNPVDPNSSFATVKSLVSEIKGMGMKTLLSVHYSDTWADPGQQAKPAIWAAASFNDLKDSVYLYTKKIVAEINPEYIQIGNEINPGLLLPDGAITASAQMKQLLQKGITAVREVNPATQIIVHYAGQVGAAGFFSLIADLDYDIIGLSYYPQWHGKDLDALKQNLISISTAQNRPILIAETSYPFSFGFNDFTNNVIGTQDQILSQYPATPQGQKDYLNKIKAIAKEVPKCIGFCYWGAEWVSYKGPAATNGSTWENQAFWSFQNTSLPVLDCYK
jgi:arabinogalactan endo-1,4-beta-galactosidase